MFYLFRQNNSGGSFEIDLKAGIGPHVWIEAESSKEANRKAEDLGIYFDGCATGIDCDCCRDRWCEVRDKDAMPEPDIDQDYDFYWHDSVYVHYANGTVKAICQTDGGK